MGQTDARMAIPSVRCSHEATSTGEQCRRYARPGTSVCAKHGARRDDIADKANQTMTLATLLASDPRPVFEVLQDAIHTLDSVHRQSKVDALKQASEDGSGAISPEAVTELVNASRGAAAVSLAATRTAAWQAIATSHERSVNLQAGAIAAVLESSLAGLWPWLESLGLSKPDLHRVKRSVALGLRASLEAMSAGAPADRSGRPQLPPASPPSGVAADLVIVPRAEIESMRNTIMRLRPQLSDKPAQVYVPDDIEPAPEPSPGSASDRRPPSVGLISTTATRHYRGR